MLLRRFFSVFKVKSAGTDSLSIQSLRIRITSVISVCIVVASALLPGNMVCAQSPKEDSLKAVLSTLPEDTNRVNTLFALLSLQTNANAIEAIQTATEATQLARKLQNKKMQGKAYSRIAFLYNRTGDPVKASDYLLQALKIYEELKDSTWIAAMNNNMGLIYSDREENEEALGHFDKALAIWKKRDFKSGITRALTNMAEIYQRQGKGAKALENYKQSLAICEEIDDKRFSATVLNLMGTFYFQEKDYMQALQYHERALKVAIEQDDRPAQTEIYANLGQVYITQQQPDKALAVALKGIDVARSIDYKVALARNYEKAMLASSMKSDYKHAYNYQALYHALNDSLKNSENISEVQRLNHTHELDRKEAEITLLQQQHKADLFRRNTFLTAGVLLVIIGGLLYNRQKLKNKRQLERNEHQLQIKEQQLDFLKQSLLEKSELLEKMNKELEAAQAQPEEHVQIEKFNRILESNILTQEDWENFKRAFEEVYPNFFAMLRYKYQDITAAELRLAALLRMNLSLKESAKMLGVSPDSVKQSRYRLKKRLNLSENDSLEEFINRLDTRGAMRSVPTQV
ncbi:MAG TPA: tetratricopeptide repeat protein [Ohtaekwangia sp.]|uniref:tetratricopeptide repeat protein n=1 Tax=Ohtaekwangia sp. TaxID=2066019 RepID=UPI002F9570A9